MTWRAHPGPQQIFCSSPEFEVLFGGAAGPGKTDCLVMEATRFVKHQRYRGLILRRTFPQLQEIIDRCWLWYPKISGNYKSGEHRWYFPSGGMVQLGHMQHEADKYNYQGKEFHFIGFDEVTQFTETQYTYLHSRARSTDPEIPVRIRATTNPGGLGHLWCKERFVDVAKPLSTYIDPQSGQSRCFIPANIYDNPTLIENDPNYIKRLESLPEIEKLRLLYGVWDVFEGQVFTELSQKTHGCEAFDIPPEWEKFMAFDWGYSRPWGAFWFAVDFDGVLYLYREYYGAKDYKDWIAGTQRQPDWNKGARQTNIEICREILDLEHEKINYRVADPACWAPTKLKGSNKNFGPSFVEDARGEGLFFLKADNDRIRGKQQVHQRFKLEEETGPDGEVTNEYPRFLGFNTCKRWWVEMQALYEDPKNPEDVDTDQPDEGYDCFRYAAMSRPIIPKKRTVERKGTFQAERNRLIRAKKYARRHGISLAAAYARVR